MSRDPAFQWESEMLRSSRRRSPTGAESRAGVTIDDASDWLTLREASDATGVPTSTIRKWARHENIPSFLEKTPDGYLRVVSLTGIERWAGEIGRDIETSQDSEGEGSPGAAGEVDLTANSEVADGVDEAAVPEGSMIVPLDAWNRMLNQLGNLHEAGQQLAEARERAAKAETEAGFLRERLADLRQELEKTRESAPDNQEPPAPSSSRSLARRAYEGWRAMRRGRG